MEVFALRDRLVGDYRNYAESFLTIRDDRVRQHVRDELDRGLLRPDPQIQLNPAFEPGETIDELVKQGLLHPETSRVFRVGKESSTDEGRHCDSTATKPTRSPPRAQLRTTSSPRGPARERRRTFVAELKSEMAFDNYRYLRLRSIEQLRAERRGGAFRAFLDLAQDPTAYDVRLAGCAVRIDGAVLIWGATTAVGRSAAIDHFALADVLSLEGMLADLSAWGSASWRMRVAELRGWSDELFAFLDP